MTKEEAARRYLNPNSKLKKPLCRYCAHEFTNIEFLEGKFEYVESKVSGKVWICKNCMKVYH